MTQVQSFFASDPMILATVNFIGLVLGIVGLAALTIKGWKIGRLAVTRTIPGFFSAVLSYHRQRVAEASEDMHLYVAGLISRANFAVIGAFIFTLTTAAVGVDTPIAEISVEANFRIFFGMMLFVGSSVSLSFFNTDVAVRRRTLRKIESSAQGVSVKGARIS